MIAIAETLSRPTYTCEFKDLNWERLKPPGIRYQPRKDPLIGMFDTSRPLATKTSDKARPGTSHAYATPEQVAKAAATRPIQPHSIASRCIAALRASGEKWTTTAELVELVNRHRPEHCTVATLTNIYTALKAPRKRGMVESRPSETVKQGLEWRVSK
jgi:hypothetical protein